MTTADTPALLSGVAGLVRRMAGSLSGRGIDTGDLEQAAWLAVLRALPRFDPARPTSFAAFARPVIRGAMLDARRELSGAVRVPKGGPTLARKWREAESELTAEVGWSPTDGEVAARLGWSAAKARRARQAIAARRAAVAVGTGGRDEGESGGEFDPIDANTDDPAGWAAAVEMITSMTGGTTMSTNGTSNGHTNGHASVADLLPARGDEDEHDAIDRRVLDAGTRLANRGGQASNRAIAAEAGLTTWAVKMAKGRLEAAGRWTFPKYRPEGRTPGKGGKAKATTDAKGKGRPGKPRPSSPPAAPLPIPLPAPRPSASSSTGSTLMRGIEAVRVIAQALEGLGPTSVSRVLAFVTRS